MMHYTQQKIDSEMHASTHYLYMIHVTQPTVKILVYISQASMRVTPPEKLPPSLLLLSNVACSDYYQGFIQQQNLGSVAGEDKQDKL